MIIPEIIAVGLVALFGKTAFKSAKEQHEKATEKYEHYDDERLQHVIRTESNSIKRLAAMQEYNRRHNRNTD